jgi:hypothetical protein
VPAHLAAVTLGNGPRALDRAADVGADARPHHRDVLQGPACRSVAAAGVAPW